MYNIDKGQKVKEKTFTIPYIIPSQIKKVNTYSGGKHHVKNKHQKGKRKHPRVIVNNFTPEDYTDKTFSTFPEIAKFILETFRAEKFNGEMKRYYKGVEPAAFADWCAGLPSLLDTCYYYNRSACDDLAENLEKTEVEKALYKARHTESYAEMYLTNLIYRELKRGETV